MRRVDCPPTRSVVPRPGRCRASRGCLGGSLGGSVTPTDTGKVVRCRRQLVASVAAAGVREVSLQLRRRNADSANKAKVAVLGLVARLGGARATDFPEEAGASAPRRVSVTFRT